MKEVTNPRRRELDPWMLDEKRFDFIGPRRKVKDIPPGIRREVFIRYRLQVRSSELFTYLCASV